MRLQRMRNVCVIRRMQRVRNPSDACKYKQATEARDFKHTLLRSHSERYLGTQQTCLMPSVINAPLAYAQA